MQRINSILASAALCGGVLVMALAQASTAQAPPTPGSATLHYDSKGQIAEEIYPANSAQHTFDAAGNRVKLGSASGLGPRWHSSSSQSHVAELKCRRTSMPSRFSGSMDRPALERMLT